MNEDAAQKKAPLQEQNYGDNLSEAKEVS